MPQETHTKPTHSAGVGCCRDFEPFRNCFSTTNCDCAGESTCSRGPVYDTFGSHTTECIVQHVRMEPTTKV